MLTSWVQILNVSIIFFLPADIILLIGMILTGSIYIMNDNKDIVYLSLTLLLVERVKRLNSILNKININIKPQLVRPL